MDKILITGGAGFIGRALTAELLEHGYAVRVLDCMLDQVHGDARPAELRDAELLVGDVRDVGLVARALEGVDGVVHLAAEVGVGQSMYEIARYVGTNDLGTATLLEAIIARRVRRIVVASSMSVYGEGLYETVDGTRYDRGRRDPARMRDALWDPVDEQERPLTPIRTDEDKNTSLASIYALTKYAQERAVMIFGAAYGVESVALRLFNVFGPGQALANPYTGVLANFASRLANGQAPTIFEDGEQHRDFVHVRDVARAFRLALEQPAASGEVINVGSGHVYTVRRVAELLAHAMGVPQIAPEIMGRARSGDIRHCIADIGRARTLLGFEPRFTLEDTVGELAEWVRGQVVVDRGAQMRRELEARGLVS
ncbi:MAG: NAD-dependent epimerase/dehydratase family protein [Gluconacetobacter diazotrophicus]|nr:NAD-dependent epimerase/dehydratase family protein [Gluconacetobacter diazotrophicus]